LLAGELSDPAGALETYHEVLKTDPDNAEAIAAVRTLAQNDDQRAEAGAILEPVLRPAPRWDDLVTPVELKLRSLDDPVPRRDALRELAAVHETGRKDNTSAFDTLRRALHEDPAHGATLADLERLSTKLDRWGDLAAMLEDESRGITDEAVARDLAVRAAQIA